MEADPHLNVKALIDASKLLSAKGLPRIFAGLDVFPWDIKVDAENLYKRWMKGDLDVSLMKGIEVTKKKTVSYKLEKSYKDKISAHTFGANGLTNGDWWLLRVGALRDGAHGAIEAGIHGKSGHGAYSIVLAAGGYADEDNGEVSFFLPFFLTSLLALLLLLISLIDYPILRHRFRHLEVNQLHNLPS